MTTERVEVVVVGGGPAGLSAALLLGRCRRRTIVFEAGHHRNDEAHAMHGYLSRDGTPPGELLRIGRGELRPYPSVELRAGFITTLRREDGDFLVITAAGAQVRARRLLIATGVADIRPPIEGADALHGRTVVPCPYCDGWELRDRPLAAYSHADDRGARYAATLAQWSRDVVLYPDGGAAALSPTARSRLTKLGVTVDERPIVRASDDPGGVRLHFADGTSTVRAALFYHLGCEPSHALADQLGAKSDDAGGIAVDVHGATSVPGLYAAGDATRDTLQAIVGAGEGAAAAMSINASLTTEDWEALAPATG